MTTNQFQISDNGVPVPKEWVKIACAEELQKHVRDFGKELSKQFENAGEIVVVCILKGAMYFCTDFTRNFTPEHSLYAIECSSYGDKKEQGKTEILSIINPSKFKGKKVVLVDELYDNGATMDFCKKEIHKKAEIPLDDIYTVAFLKKKKENALGGLDMFALSVPDVWLVGYGLDHKQKLRNLTDLWAVPKEKEEMKTVGDKEVFGN